MAKVQKEIMRRHFLGGKVLAADLKNKRKCGVCNHLLGRISLKFTQIYLSEAINQICLFIYSFWPAKGTLVCGNRFNKDLEEKLIGSTIARLLSL